MTVTFDVDRHCARCSPMSPPRGSCSSSSSCTRWASGRGPSVWSSGCSPSLVALGLALIYRANRILNFAQGDLGTVPTTLAVGLIAVSGVPYLVGLVLGLLAAIVLGVVVELAIIRRFTRSPRLLLTVATIGLSQLLIVCRGPAPAPVGREDLHQPDPAGSVRGRDRGGKRDLRWQRDHGLDRGPVAARGPGPVPAGHRHRHRRAGQRRTLRSGRPARGAGPPPADPGVGDGRHALVRRRVPAGVDLRVQRGGDAQSAGTRLRPRGAWSSDAWTTSRPSRRPRWRCASSIRAWPPTTPAPSAGSTWCSPRSC